MFPWFSMMCSFPLVGEPFQVSLIQPSSLIQLVLASSLWASSVSFQAELKTFNMATRNSCGVLGSELWSSGCKHLTSELYHSPYVFFFQHNLCLQFSFSFLAFETGSCCTLQIVPTVLLSQLAWCRAVVRSFQAGDWFSARLIISHFIFFFAVSRTVFLFLTWFRTLS